MLKKSSDVFNVTAVCLQGSCVLGAVGFGELPGWRWQSPVAHGPPAHTSLHRSGWHTIWPHAPEPPTPTGKTNQNVQDSELYMDDASLLKYRQGSEEHEWKSQLYFDVASGLDWISPFSTVGTPIDHVLYLIPPDSPSAANAWLHRQKQREVHRLAELRPSHRLLQQEKPQGQHTPWSTSCNMFCTLVLFLLC